MLCDTAIFMHEVIIRIYRLHIKFIFAINYEADRYVLLIHVNIYTMRNVFKRDFSCSGVKGAFSQSLPTRVF